VDDDKDDADRVPRRGGFDDPASRRKREPIMRRWLFAFAAFAGLMCGLTGCHHTAGVCDCDIEEDRCATCAPWYRGPVAPVGHTEPVPPPAVNPSGL
jgi:hypothetical protein